ncbi:alcohol dehydrogenase catalytic domain-containing protein [Blautia producta]|uniref:L-threonine 3-dehydrogenase n=2 Tax=Blautia producta TaxID=33035 RepID=A0A7G5MNF9_9FIRM|nr:alcohol dehydrogenase catalytic domain-containing protein [Blautia producta]QIB55980.1 alcohol dehydrogenase catalytic domain-containing protein [Blautia producta ATCC 27340 = DSM 2950]QMW76152.1 L-threonine 3-dehydrogenase [Blautia producta]
MKAILKDKREAGFTLADIPVPEIGRNEVLIKVEASALCRSDVDVYEWTPLVEKANYDLPFVMGHEFAGTIVKTGEDVQGYKPGDRVAGETHIPCGYCETCRTGNQHICGNHMGVLGRTVDGCFAEYIALHQKALIRLPENLSFQEGAILEPFATAMHAVSKANPSGRSLLIAGTGTIGQMAVEIAKYLGCTKLFAVDISDTKLQESRKRGADVTINGMKEDLVEIVKRETDGYGVDAVIDFTGNERVINQEVEAVKIAGTIVHVGMVEKPLTYRNFMYGVVYKELIVTGIFGRRMYETWTEVMNILKTGKIDLRLFVAKEMKLEDFQEANREFPNVSGRIVFQHE